MSYIIIRKDKKKDQLTGLRFKTFKEAYDLLKEIHGGVYGTNANYENMNSYEIIAKKLFKNQEVSCLHCKRTPSNGIKCLGMCVADSEY